ncbi:dTDP-4-dehydrorhamnose 3,5-epimerase [BD1-7 clade bacterium]|uniref:dTDP-4-dehydrorhamnose 3,5-epimerase n=1 Tax=BD1-7 clade bacterium TaxID=2029982 RepID=A0A5S9MRK4_9GAMM|nr:dTDP-4-dehydrorhamnose 3,5-epimerase [BD1-7 clade bacterium]
MKFIRTAIPDVILIEPTIHGDERGYFTETFRQDAFEEFLGFKVPFCQDNESKSNKGVLRGLHYQLAPAAQSKLVRVVHGSVLDVAVDIRQGSATYGHHVAVELTGKNKKQLFVPRGFAHGFLVLEDDTVFTYKVDNLYAPELDRGIAYDDKQLAVNWMLSGTELLLSEKDRVQPALKDAETFSVRGGFYEN